MAAASMGYGVQRARPQLPNDIGFASFRRSTSWCRTLEANGTGITLVGLPRVGAA